MRHQPSLAVPAVDLRPTIWGCGIAFAGWALLVVWIYQQVTR